MTDELARLDLHDSVLLRLELSCAGRVRRCVLDVDYYDWEGNGARRRLEPDAPWQWRALRIRFGRLAALEYSMPGVPSRAIEIDRAELGHGLAALEAHERAMAARYPAYVSPLLDAAGPPVSLSLFTHDWDDTTQGAVRIIGADVTLEWDVFPASRGEQHVPIARG